MKNSQVLSPVSPVLSPSPLSPLIPVCVLACMLSSPALAGGGMAAGQPAAAQQQVAGKPAETATGLARTAKTSMGVRIRYAVDSPTVGGRSQVRLKVQRPASGQPLTIELAPSGGLRLDSNLPASNAVQTAASVDYVLSLVPQSEGLHYIHVYLRSGEMAEALAIPVQVGKTKKNTKAADIKTMPDGQRVISIPAQQ